MDRQGMVRWGIIGTGRIAERFVRSLAGSNRGTLLAVADRKEQKLSAFAAEHGAPHAYTSYEDLLANPDVDAVYIALPHGLHADWSIRALRQGKAVLCEKPATLSEEQMRGMAAAARETGQLYMEAMKTRFVPLHQQVMDLVSSGELGDVTFVDASQCYAFPADINNYFVDPVQGGCLYDEGIYCVSWLDELTHGDASVQRVELVRRRGVDWYDNVQMNIGSVPVQLEVAADRGPRSMLRIELERGSIDVPVLHRPQTAVVHRFGTPDEPLSAPYVGDDFTGEIEHFQDLLLAGKHESPVMPLEASLRCAHLIDQIRAAWPDHA